MNFCSLTYLSMMDWSKIEKEVLYRIEKGIEGKEAYSKYLKFKSRLNNVMNNGYMSFSNSEEEDSFMLQANRYVYASKYSAVKY